MNILFLDMDGVLNNHDLTIQWAEKRLKEIKKNITDKSDIKLREIVMREFNQYMCMGTEYIFKQLADRLNEVITKCDLKIVWSTSWRNISKYNRNIDNAKEMLNRRGVIGDALIGYTPFFGYEYGTAESTRISEILYCVMNNKFSISYNDKIGVIDDLDLSEIESYKYGIKFFQTKMKTGLTNKIKNDMLKFYSK